MKPRQAVQQAARQRHVHPNGIDHRAVTIGNRKAAHADIALVEDGGRP
jgi:hypothetical protein